jgi:hypothetical protein
MSEKGKNRTSIRIPVSIGELWDKYSILSIKIDRIIDENKRINIQLEIIRLDTYMEEYDYMENPLYVDLKKTNETLWDIENDLRLKESWKEFDSEFIELARSVYYTNDKRAEIKKQINETYQSDLHEVKEYSNYQA